MKPINNFSIAVPLVCICLLFEGQRTLAQPVNFSLTQVVDEAGGRTFDFAIGPSRFGGLSGFGGIRDVLIAPNGLRFSKFARESVGGLSFAEFQDGFVGNWLIEQQFVLPPSIPEIFNFSISPFELTSVFSAPPTVRSPANGSRVGMQFEFDWQYGAGVAEPNSRSLNIRGLRPAIVTFGSGSEASIDVELPDGVFEQEFTISAGTVSFLDQFVSEVRTAEQIPTEMYGVEFSFYNFTNPITLTAVAVPEPALLPLALTAFTAFVARRRR